MKSYLKIFITKNLMQLQTDLSYRTESLFMLLTTVVSLSTTIVMYILLFTQVNLIGDWNLTDLLYLFAIGNIAISLYTMFSWGSIYHQFRPAVKMGDLDYFLLKPRSPYYLLSTGRFDFSGLARFLPSLGLLAYLVLYRPLPVGSSALALFLIVTVVGIILLHTTIFIFYSLSFWSTSTDYFHYFAWAIIGATTMPLNALPNVVYWVFSTIFPVTYAAVIPVRLVTGLEKLSPGLALQLLAIPAIFFAASAVVWKRGLRHYSGASA